MPERPDRTRWLLVATITAFLLCLLHPHNMEGAEEKAEYRIAVFPQQPPVVMHASWTPLVEQLEKKSGVGLRLKLYENMADFEADIGKGNADFIFSTPSQLVAARRMQGYMPLVRGSRKISGVLFVRRDSPIQTIGDLQGEEIAFVGSWNVCSTLVQQALRRERTPIRFKQLYAGSASNVVKHVLLGKTAAGSVLDTVFDSMEPAARAQLRPLMETPKIFPHPLSAHPRVPKAVREKMASAMLHLQEDEEGKSLLRSLRIIDPVRADYQHDYRQLEGEDLRMPREE